MCVRKCGEKKTQLEVRFIKNEKGAAAAAAYTFISGWINKKRIHLFFLYEIPLVLFIFNRNNKI